MEVPSAIPVMNTYSSSLMASYPSYSFHASPEMCHWSTSTNPTCTVSHSPLSFQDPNGFLPGALRCHSFPFTGMESKEEWTGDRRERREEEEASLLAVRGIPFEYSTMVEGCQENMENEEESTSRLDTSSNDGTDPRSFLMDCGSSPTCTSTECCNASLVLSSMMRWNPNLVADALVRGSLLSQQEWEKLQYRMASEQLSSSCTPRSPLAIAWHGNLAIDGLTSSGKRKREPPALDSSVKDVDLAFEEEGESRKDLGGIGTRQSEDSDDYSPPVHRRKREEEDKDLEGAAWSHSRQRKDHHHHEGHLGMGQCSNEKDNHQKDTKASWLCIEDEPEGALRHEEKVGVHCREIEGSFLDGTAEFLGNKRLRAASGLEVSRVSRRMES